MLNTYDANEFYAHEAGNVDVMEEDTSDEIKVDGHTYLKLENGLLTPVCNHKWDEGEQMGFGFKRCLLCGVDYE